MVESGTPPTIMDMSKISGFGDNTAYKASITHLDALAAKVQTHMKATDDHIASLHGHPNARLLAEAKHTKNGLTIAHKLATEGHPHHESKTRDLVYHTINGNPKKRQEKLAALSRKEKEINEQLAEHSRASRS
jgi:hypothetical protein